MAKEVNKGKECSVDGCHYPAFCKTFCKAHYEQVRQHGRITGLVVPHIKARGGITKDNQDEYRAWNLMKRRCLNKNTKEYPNYGGRGIKICDRWIHNFSNFLDDMGKKSKGCSLDRINPDGDYCPENCRWADWWEQERNRRNSRAVPCIRPHRRRYLLIIQHGENIYRKICPTLDDAICLRDKITNEWRKNA